MLLSPWPSPQLLVMGRTMHFQCVHCPLGECLGWAQAGTVNQGINGGHIPPKWLQHRDHVKMLTGGKTARLPLGDGKESCSWFDKSVTNSSSVV